MKKLDSDLDTEFDCMNIEGIEFPYPYNPDEDEEFQTSGVETNEKE
jgi:hypothetical protein